MDNYVGEIKQFAGDYAPKGWAFCDGRLLPKDQYEMLFSLIGYEYGGDGSQFAVPDLRGRVPIHMSDSYPRTVKSGHEEVTLTEAQLPSHNHVVYASSSVANDNNGPANGFWGSSSTDAGWAAPPSNSTMNADCTKATGGGKPHENRIPFVAISYIISLEGIYPSRS